MAALFTAVYLVLLFSLSSAGGSTRATCGDDTPIRLSPGSKQSFTTLGYPKLYDSQSSCSWNFVTDKGGKLVTKCVISIPCNDNFTIAFSSGPGRTHCGVKHIREVGTDSVTVSLQPAANSEGGFARCVAVSLASTPAEPDDSEKIPALGKIPPKANGTIAATTKKPQVGNTTCPCGVKGPNRIVGGTAAGLREYPWMIMLYEGSDGPFCGGSIIAPRWVLTAAHCTEGSVASSLKVIAGSYYVDVTSATTQVRQVSKIVQHPSYDSGTENNDISLLQLATAFTYTTAVAPICLPFSFPTFGFANQTGFGTGWGTTSSGGSSSSKLLEVTLPILSTAQCKQYPKIAPSITSNMICTYKAGKDTCQGDSGGPLNWIDPKSKRVFAAGIVSFGVGCAQVGYPGVYTKVNNYLTWIKTNTGLTFCNP